MTATTTATTVAKRGPLPPNQAAIVWALKLGGDINETHKGGNAARALFDRITEQGFVYRTYKNFNNSIYILKTKGIVQRIQKGTQTYALRLLDDSQMGDNPFVGKALVPFVEPETLLGDMRSWPITKRCQLMRELSDSIAIDMNAYKGVVAESL